MANAPRNTSNSSSMYELSPTASGVIGQASLPNAVPTERSFRGMQESSALPNLVARRIRELVMQLTDTYITLTKGHPMRSPEAKIGQADRFFTVTNVRVFIETYFHHFHPNLPIIHRASFDINSTSPRLLLALCLAGSSYTSLSNAITIGRSLLDLAEEFIFRHIIFKSPSKERFIPGDISKYAAHLEVLQAAVIIITLQQWEGNEKAQRRARTERHNTIVSVLVTSTTI
jgi:hypothetical protein